MQIVTNTFYWHIYIWPLPILGQTSWQFQQRIWKTSDHISVIINNNEWHGLWQSIRRRSMSSTYYLTRSVCADWAYPWLIICCCFVYYCIHCNFLNVCTPYITFKSIFNFKFICRPCITSKSIFNFKFICRPYITFKSIFNVKFYLRSKTSSNVKKNRNN